MFLFKFITISLLETSCPLMLQTKQIWKPDLCWKMKSFLRCHSNVGSSLFFETNIPAPALTGVYKRTPVKLMLEIFFKRWSSFTGVLRERRPRWGWRSQWTPSYSWPAFSEDAGLIIARVFGERRYRKTMQAFSENAYFANGITSAQLKRRLRLSPTLCMPSLHLNAGTTIPSVFLFFPNAFWAPGNPVFFVDPVFFVVLSGHKRVDES